MGPMKIDYALMARTMEVRLRHEQRSNYFWAGFWLGAISAEVLVLIILIAAMAF